MSGCLLEYVTLLWWYAGHAQPFLRAFQPDFEELLLRWLQQDVSACLRVAESLYGSVLSVHSICCTYRRQCATVPG